MEIFEELNEELLKQPFADDEKQLAKYRCVASEYAQVENAIAVLSDMKANKSYIYFGGIADELGIKNDNDEQVIDSIWENDIFSRVHPDDLRDKHLEEFRFYHFVKSKPKKQRKNYFLYSNMRMKNAKGAYINILHRMFYLTYDENGCVQLALCLYNMSVATSMSHLIVNSRTGERFEMDKQSCDDILTSREKEVLRLIEAGNMSKEIAHILSISLNTVSRHRQNILEKLQAKNSIEACQTAKNLKII